MCSLFNTSNIKYLVENRADVNSETENGETPLLMARRKGHTEIVNFLTNRTRSGGGEVTKNKKKTRRRRANRQTSASHRT